MGKPWAEYFAYLDDLRESGETNMYGARPYLIRKFSLDGYEAGEILAAWRKAFSKDKSPAERAELVP